MSDVKTIFKWSCLGCLGILGLVIFVVGGTVGVVWRDVKKEVPRTTVATVDPVPTTEAAAPADGITRIALDVGYVDVTIQSVVDDQPLRIEATYDERSFAFEQTTVDADVAGGAIWNISFRKTSRLPFTGLRKVFGGTSSRILIEVPNGQRVALEGRVHDGVLQGELGGMNLNAVDVELQRGAVIVSIDRPLVEPMQRFAIDANQGANIISGLGNASPREVDMVCRMGACIVDLTGEWRNDATINLDAAMSGAVLTMADDVTHDGLDGVKGFDRLDPPPLQAADAEIPLPVLRFTIKGKWELQ